MAIWRFVSRSTAQRKAEISFEIKEGEVTLLRVPGGDMEFQDLDVVELALLNQFVQESVADWFPDIRRAMRASRPLRRVPRL